MPAHLLLYAPPSIVFLLVGNKYQYLTLSQEEEKTEEDGKKETSSMADGAEENINGLMPLRSDRVRTQFHKKYHQRGEFLCRFETNEPW